MCSAVIIFVGAPGQSKPGGLAPFALAGRLRMSSCATAASKVLSALVPVQ